MTLVTELEVVWSHLQQAWRAKELAAAIDHSAPLFGDCEAQAAWEQAKLCLQAVLKLGTGWYP